MASVLSNYYGNILLATLATNGGWLALHNADPTVTGDPTTEIAGTVRAAVAFSSPSGKAVGSTNSQLIITSADDITYLGIWDNQVGGHLLFSIELGSPLAADASGQFLAASGDIGLQL